MIEVKEIKLRPGIDVHDYDIKMRAMKGFLGEGDKVKVTLRFRGREMAHQELGMKVLDRVRADVSWTGGVTGALKTARVAEAFGMNCELHTTIFAPLELVNLHVAAAVKNCEFFELLCPTEAFAFGLKGVLPVIDGMAHPPTDPGLGMELDWQEIESCTLAVL